MFQENPDDFVVSLFGGDVKRRVEVVRGGVWRGSMLQQQDDVVDVTEA